VRGACLCADVPARYSAVSLRVRRPIAGSLMWVIVSWLHPPHSVHINKICTNNHIPQLETITIFCRVVLITQMRYSTGELLSSGCTLRKSVVVVGGGPEASLCVGMAMNNSSFVANFRLLLTRGILKVTAVPPCAVQQAPNGRGGNQTL